MSERERRADDILAILGSEDLAIQVAIENDILYAEMICPLCERPMKANGLRWRCNNRSCKRKEISIFVDTIFYKSHLTVNKVIMIGYLWATGLSASQICHITGVNKNTITFYMNSYRTACSSYIETTAELIGGDQIIVEVDESKFGKRKFNRGHRVTGSWVVGGIERTDRKRFFAVVVESRDKDTLWEVISTHVAEGSVIYTDCWAAYNILDEMEVEHGTVNHSLHYKDPETGVHTNTIEGLWNGIKMQIPPRRYGRNDLQHCIFEVMWRKQHKDDLWTALLELLRDTRFE